LSLVRFAVDGDRRDHKPYAERLERRGNLRETSTPITVAVAGSSETISEYVARVRRATASWSNT